jgi:threonine synthase
MTSGSALDHLECARCGRVRPFGPDPAGLCGCGAPLLARYRVAEARRGLRRRSLAGRPRSLWRYAEMLPGVSPITLGEGLTPLLPARRLGSELGLTRLYVKDEAVNPTGSFKARGMSVAVSVAAAQGVRAAAAPSAGNAGSALAAYGARAGWAVHLFLPESTPAPFQAEARRLGAEVSLVPGSIADAGRVMRGSLAAPAGASRGWFDLSTLREPFRVEGKKTMAYEVVEQLGFEVPDVVLYPTGGGTGLIGMWKGFAEMEALGWIGPRRPRMVSVQAVGCAPIVRAFLAGREGADPWPAPETRAAGLRVPASLGDFLMLRALRESGGVALAVEDHEMMEGAARLGGLEGIDACPEGGAAVAALRRLREGGAIGDHETVVLFNTGTGLKYAWGPGAATTVASGGP